MTRSRRTRPPHVPCGPCTTARCAGTLLLSCCPHRQAGGGERLALPPSTAIATAGGLAGAAAWLGNLPLDCVKSGVQGQDLRRGGFANNRGRIGFAESARAVVRARGVFGVFSGAAPSISRSFIVSGSRFVAFAGGMELLQGEGSANERT